MAFKCARYTLANMLPVAFVFCIVGTIWSLYTSLHLFYMLHIWKPRQLGVEEVFDDDMFHRGVWHTVISHFFTTMLLVNFAIVFSTDPGSVPENGEWMPSRRSDELLTSHRTSEVKHSGMPRYCKWCECYKPDRCHHCRVCRSCILRMDHHCPWIANCVGYNNHKYFLLLVFYSLCSCLFISCTMSESLHRCLTEETTFLRRFMVVFGVTLSSMMGMLLTLFFSLHVWLMLRATTTIEFCEKAYKRNGENPHAASIYHLSYYENLTSVLGPNPLLWLLPMGLPKGDGLGFPLSEAAQNQMGQQQGPSTRTSSRAASVAGDGAREPLAGIPEGSPEVTGQGASTS